MASPVAAARSRVVLTVVPLAGSSPGDFLPYHWTVYVQEGGSMYVTERQIVLRSGTPMRYHAMCCGCGMRLCPL